MVGGTWVPATAFFLLVKFPGESPCPVRTVFFLSSSTAQSYFPVFTLLRALYFVCVFFYAGNFVEIFVCGLKHHLFSFSGAIFDCLS